MEYNKYVAFSRHAILLEAFRCPACPTDRPVFFFTHTACSSLFSQISENQIRVGVVMITTIPPRIGIESSAASLSLARGSVRHRPDSAVTMDHGEFSTPPTRSMPTWMRSPRLMVTKRRYHHQPMDTRTCASRLGGTGLVRETAIAQGVRNGGLLVRGGGGSVSPAGLLGGVLFATAFLSAVLERQTKIGSVVGAPLLSFGTFCLLRYHKYLEGWV